jgi:DICT domain-containing protein
MSLTELIAGVESHRKTLTVFNADEGVVDAFRERLGDRNVSVAGATATAGPESYAVLSRGGEFVTAVSVDDVLTEREHRSVGFAESAYKPILDNLDETLFTSFQTDKMVAASREIEDRAWRAGRGELHSGFQYASTFGDQAEVYDRLADRDGLNVHVYVYPDEPPRRDGGYTVHSSESDELRRSWFVVFDGGGLDQNKCGLLAEEREAGSGRFYGFWTYDAGTVDYILEYLRRQYALVDTDGTGSEFDADDFSVPGDV